MKESEHNLARQAQEALRSLLEGIPFLRVIAAPVEAAPRPGPVTRPDLILDVGSPKGKQRLVLEIRASGQPRIAREAINQLIRYRAAMPKAYGIFAAPYISPDGAALCAAEGIGYMDLSGNCKLSFDAVYIEKAGRPNRFAQKRDLRSLYSPKASRVLRVLMHAPARTWTVSKLAKEAKVSLGQASNVKALLADREWISVGPKGVALVKPGKLLEEWAENYSFRRNESRDCYSLKTPSEVEADLAEWGYDTETRYALTGFSAASRMVLSVRYQRAFAYVDAPLDAVASQLGLKQVESGANVTLLSPYDEGVFYGARQFEGVSLVSPIQAYLDLRGFRGRGEEAAKDLLEEVIRPQW